MCSLKKISFEKVKAVITRLAFSVHSFIAIYRVVSVYQNNFYWLLLISLLALLAETFVTLIKKKGSEWKWFSPVIFCYLLAAVPPIWLLEIKLIDIRVQEATNIASNLSTEIIQESAVNALGLTIDIPLPLDQAGWTLALEQSLLFILILGRWFLPKGDISRNQLSQILLVYLGMAADIMELFEVFKEERTFYALLVYSFTKEIAHPGKPLQVAYSQLLIFPILSLWSCALLQYTLVITAAHSRKPRYGCIEDDATKKYTSRGCCKNICGCENINADVLGIMSTIVMQDGPFLCLRLYLLVGLDIISQMMIFFICKNVLVLLLQIYRLIVIFLEIEDDKSRNEEVSVITMSTTLTEPRTSVTSSMKNDSNGGQSNQVTETESMVRRRQSEATAQTRPSLIEEDYLSSQNRNVFDPCRQQASQSEAQHPNSIHIE